MNIITQNYQLYNGDCLEVMDYLIEQNIKVDCILTDPPCGTTVCKWDTVIPFDEMWLRLNKLIKNTGAVVLFGSEPFSSALRMSNIKNYKYDWIWIKSKASGFVNVKNAPLKKNELISVFSLGTIANGSKRRMEYNPQGLIPCNKKKTISSSKRGKNCYIGERRNQIGKEYICEFTNYPLNILEYKNETGLHPTQKPVDLLEYLIKTYTNENEIVLDFTMGSGSTGVACMNTNRKFIGIELDEGYFNIAINRIFENYNI